MLVPLCVRSSVCWSISVLIPMRVVSQYVGSSVCDFSMGGSLCVFLWYAKHTEGVIESYSYDNLLLRCIT